MLVAAALAASAADGATGPAQIRITDVQTADRLVRPAHGGTPGTVELIQQRLYNPSVARAPIGHAVLACTFVDDVDRSCTGTYELPKGNLVVAGAIQSRLLYQIAVVGGTGLYDNARGSLTVTSTRIRPRHEVLVFRLTG